MKSNRKIVFVSILSILLYFSCTQNPTKKTPITKQENYLTAKDILGNPEYLAISYGGYRLDSREKQPSIDNLKEDLSILHTMGIRILRTYNVHLPHAANVLKAIESLKEEDPSFEMYVMLGAWINCKNAWTDQTPDHSLESPDNASEIKKAVALAQEHPDVVKIIAVGNEAMVKWAAAYYVEPEIILKWVEHLQELKNNGELSKDIWITSSDNFASWGGGETQYHVPALEKLIAAVDYVSVHTYPMHDTHYNPDFWGVFEKEAQYSPSKQIDAAMLRAKQYAQSQKDSVASYMKSLGLYKPIHIGETGWASLSNGFYGDNGSKATDEYKQALFYKHMREWTSQEKMACFYFEAFDEPWKDASNPEGSENHFGLFTVEGKAKYALWELVDKDIFKGLTRGGNPIQKTFQGDKQALFKQVLVPPSKLIHQ